MNKLIGLVLAGFAVFVALFYLITKRKVTFCPAKEGSFLKRKFLTMVLALIAFFSQDKCFAMAGNMKPAADSKAETDLTDIQKTSEWQALKKIWSELKKSVSKPVENIEADVEKQKLSFNGYVEPLAAKGYFSKNVGFILNYVYGELLYHKIRSTSGWTCYKMTVMGGTLSGVRGDIEARLKALADISKKGVVLPGVLAEAKENLARDIEFMNRANILSKKGASTQYDQTYWDEEKALISLFKSGKVDKSFKADEEVSRAAELIILLNSKVDLPQGGQFNSFNEQLSGRAEWKLIKSNWNTVTQMAGIEFGSIDNVVNEKKSVNWELLKKVIQAGIVTEEGAKIFNDIYGDRIYHHLRPMAATCYEPTILGMKQQLTRDDFENRLKELAELAKDGAIEEDVLKQSEINLQKDMEMVLLINELWHSSAGGTPDKPLSDEKEILSYFVERMSPKITGASDSNIKDTLNIRKGVKEAMAIIRLIYTD